MREKKERTPAIVKSNYQHNRLIKKLKKTQFDLCQSAHAEKYIEKYSAHIDFAPSRPLHLTCLPFRSYQVSSSTRFPRGEGSTNSFDLYKSF